MSRRRHYNDKVTLEKLYLRDSGLCWICVLKGLEYEQCLVRFEDASRDHLEPFSAGGSHSDWNLKLAHKKCNGKRGTLPIDELISRFYTEKELNRNLEERL